MRYPGSEKLEIIRLVEQSHLPVRRTLATLGILPMTFYRWYARLQTGGPGALEDKPSRPRRVWNKIPEEVREQIVELALDEPELSPREVATRFTDVKKYFVSEASVYRRECQLNCVRAFHGRLSLADCSRQTLGKEDGELRIGGSPLDSGLPVDTKIPQRQVEQLGGRLI